MYEQAKPAKFESALIQTFRNIDGEYTERGGDGIVTEGTPPPPLQRGIADHCNRLQLVH
jgi:hypothetical protein